MAENGQVWCSGSNQYGQLAKPVAVRQSRKLATQAITVDGAITHSCIPVLIAIQDCIKISSGWHHVVALGTP
jgi:alpha-tubulin suppressor-like RCC1 family protein